MVKTYTRMNTSTYQLYISKTTYNPPFKQQGTLTREPAIEHTQIFETRH